MRRGACAGSGGPVGAGLGGVSEVCAGSRRQGRGAGVRWGPRPAGAPGCRRRCADPGPGPWAPGPAVRPPPRPRGPRFPLSILGVLVPYPAVVLAPRPCVLLAELETTRCCALRARPGSSRPPSSAQSSCAGPLRALSSARPRSLGPPCALRSLSAPAELRIIPCAQLFARPGAGDHPVHCGSNLVTPARDLRDFRRGGGGEVRGCGHRRVRPAGPRDRVCGCSGALRPAAVFLGARVPWVAGSAFPAASMPGAGRDLHFCFSENPGITAGGWCSCVSVAPLCSVMPLHGPAGLPTFAFAEATVR